MIIRNGDDHAKYLLLQVKPFQYCTQGIHIMKISVTLIFLLFLTPAYAEIYKCRKNGSTSYQQTQCKQTGTEFALKKDISIEQQEAAEKKLTADLELIAEKKKLQKEADDKERLIRAQEENAKATYENAKASKAQAEETARQTKAIENRNNTPTYYSPYYPKRPIQKPMPKPPIARPAPLPPMARPLPATTR